MKLSDHAISEQPENVFWHVGNIFVKKIYLAKKGFCTIGHSHTYDHMTLVVKGAVSIQVDGKAREFHENESIEIASRRHHAITALEDDTMLLCIHDTRGMELEELAVPFDYSKETHHV